MSLPRPGRRYEDTTARQFIEDWQTPEEAACRTRPITLVESGKVGAPSVAVLTLARDEE
jgi:hypothetical protein